jgi:hypothetical protein
LLTRNAQAAYTAASAKETKSVNLMNYASEEKAREELSSIAFEKRAHSSNCHKIINPLKALICRSNKHISSSFTLTIARKFYA